MQHWLPFILPAHVGQAESWQKPGPCGGELPEADSRSASGGSSDSPGGEEESREGEDHEWGGPWEAASSGGVKCNRQTLQKETTKDTSKPKLTHYILFDLCRNQSAKMIHTDIYVPDIFQEVTAPSQEKVQHITSHQTITFLHLYLCTDLTNNK